MHSVVSDKGRGRRRVPVIFLCAALAALLIAGCATESGKVYEKDGKRYGVTKGTFRGRWWNYFERGDSYIEGGYYQDAAADFMTALKQRDKDGRRSRTYGMHFVDYFPHRELGIAYLGMGRPEDAVRELETSLSEQDTAKAKFYLNKARKAVLAKANETLPGPELSLVNQEETLTNKLQLKISGTATSGAFVSGVKVGGRPLLVELSSKSLPFETTVDLKEGQNTVKVEAADLMGKTCGKTLKVLVVRRGPVIELESPEASTLVPGGRVLVKGTAYDPAGVSGIRLNGKELALSKGSEVEFSETVEVPSNTPVEITAVDAAGNTTTARVEPGLPEPVRTGDDGQTHGTLYAQRDGTLLASAGSTQTPFIKLRDLADAQDVFYDTVYLEGSVAGGADIVKLTVNDEPVIAHKGKKLFFNCMFALKEGENKAVLKAADNLGRETTKTVEINRKPQKAHALNSRMTVSAMPFTGGAKGDAGGLSYDAFVNAMVEQKRFNLVERAKLEEVLTEQKLSQEEIADPSTAARLGKLVAAEAVLVDSIHETANSVEVFARVVDTETSEIIESQDVYGEDKSIKGLTELMEGLAVKLKNRFPLVEGMVLKKDGNEVVLDLGTQSGVKKNTLVLLFREGEHMIHPVTGKDLGAPTELLGKAKVSEVYDEMSKAEIVHTEGKGDIKAMDKVITK